ncbi:hypothetical protein [Geminicoccus roseus]|uniref:hypothetical protein n=1 Tax=Geminicoccus roseus TaxID=404900 RepID=UPI0012FC889B|nr:hypothetical protein [Geminicoccus roseus]
MLKPLAVRIGLLLFCLAWTAFEAWHEPNSIWFWMFAGVTVYAVFEFFISDKYRKAGAAPAAGSDAPPEA